MPVDTSTQTSRAPGPASGNSGWVDTLVSFLKQQIGKPYAMDAGRTGPNHYDCSGLVIAAYRQVGINMSAVSQTQAKQGQTITNYSQLQPGDLIIEDGSDPPLGHVQIYIGNGQVIQAASTKLGVIQSPVDTSKIKVVKRVMDGLGQVIQGDGSVPDHSPTLKVVPYANAAPLTPNDSGQWGSDIPGAGTANNSAGSGTTNFGTPTPTARPVTDKEVNEYVRDNYGYLVAYLNDPELGPILRDAAKQGLSKDLVYGRLSQTQWWKTTSDTSRLWEQLQSEDPATAASRLAAQRTKITNLVGKAGVFISGGQLGSLTSDSLKFGWSDEQLNDAIMAYATPGKGGYTSGDLGAYQQQVQTLASTYLMNITPADAASYAKRIASGTMTLDGVKATLQTQAKSMFANNPDMQKIIDEGATPADYFSQQRNAMAQILETSPDQIDLVNNPQYRQILDTVDPTTNKHRTMTVTEAEQVARDQDAYKNTQGARRAFLGAASQMKQTMGIQD